MSYPAHAQAAMKTIDFETPPLGAIARRVLNPYIASGVTFTALPQGYDDAVVGVVQDSATSVCVPPANANQKLGAGRHGLPDGGIGRTNSPIKATFASGLDVREVSVEFQTLAGETLQVRLYDAANREIGSAIEVAFPPIGSCGYPGSPRAKRRVTARAPERVAYAVMSVPRRHFLVAFVIDDFRFGEGNSSAQRKGKAALRVERRLSWGKCPSVTFAGSGRRRG